MVRSWRIVYFRNGQIPEDDGVTFGCSVDGIASIEEQAVDQWSIRPRGEVLSGTYAQVLSELSLLVQRGFRPDAAVAYFAKAPGMEDFLRRASMQLPQIPWGGGGAAADPALGTGRLLPTAQDVVLLLVRDGRYRFRNVWSNVHADTGKRVSMRAGDARTILALRDDRQDVPALRWYGAQREAFGFPSASYENLALATPEGWNLHASPQGEFALHTGADLPGGGELSVRAVHSVAATAAVAQFCAAEDTLVFGCAGLQSLLQSPVLPGHGSMVGFLHGEVLTVNHGPRFANLMMSGLEARLFESEVSK